VQEDVRFKITDRAADAIRKYLNEHDAAEESGLRVGVRGGGCSGLSYALDVGFLRDGDHVFEHAGERVFIDPKSVLFLNGCELDFVKGLMESGFKIVNPKAQRTCGCGESFGV